MPRNPGTPADPDRSGRPDHSGGPDRPGASEPAEDRLVAGRGPASNDWFTRPDREEVLASPPSRGTEGAADDGGPGQAGRPPERSRTFEPERRRRRPQRSEGLVKVEFSGRTGRGGARRRSQARSRSRRRPVATALAVVTASVLAVGTGVALDRLVLPELRSEPAAASDPAANQAAPPAPGTDFGTRRSTGGTVPAPTPSETPPPLKALPNGTGKPSADPEPTKSGSPGDRAPSGTGAAGGAGSTVPETAVALLTNKERAKEGCAPLRIDTRLMTAARRHSADMAANDYFDHTSRNGDSPWQRMEAAGYSSPGAENIAKGHATAAAVVEGWMKSPGHRANILNCKLRAIGVGRAAGSGGPWWTQDFGWQ
ncbi:CAP domain-containing protein [Actinomadura vinacea]